MCAVSAIFNYGMRIPDQEWTPVGWKEYRELLDKAQKFDEIMNQPDCHDDMKGRWMLRVEKRLKELEDSK